MRWRLAVICLFALVGLGIAHEIEDSIDFWTVDPFLDDVPKLATKRRLLAYQACRKVEGGFVYSNNKNADCRSFTTSELDTISGDFCDAQIGFVDSTKSGASQITTACQTTFKCVDALRLECEGRDGGTACVTEENARHDGHGLDDANHPAGDLDAAKLYIYVTSTSSLCVGGETFAAEADQLAVKMGKQLADQTKVTNFYRDYISAGSSVITSWLAVKGEWISVLQKAPPPITPQAPAGKGGLPVRPPPPPNANAPITAPAKIPPPLPPPPKTPPFLPQGKSPPPISKSQCKVSGVYRIASSRGCGATEFLMYFGGSAKLCARQITSTRTPGHVKTARTMWKLATAAQGTTPLLTAGRSCPKGSNGLAGDGSAASGNVYLAEKWHQWSLRAVNGSCSKVLIVDSSREKAGAAALLSMSGTCSNPRPFLAAKDAGKGAQHWNLVRVADKEARTAIAAYDKEMGRNAVGLLDWLKSVVGA